MTCFPKMANTKMVTDVRIWLMKLSAICISPSSRNVPKVALHDAYKTLIKHKRQTLS